ncbi:MAG: hypothetical protein ACRDYX_22265 [Egibacteraceae bacterium]
MSTFNLSSVIPRPLQQPLGGAGDVLAQGRDSLVSKPAHGEPDLGFGKITFRVRNETQRPPIRSLMPYILMNVDEGDTIEAWKSLMNRQDQLSA